MLATGFAGLELYKHHCLLLAPWVLGSKQVRLLPTSLPDLEQCVWIDALSLVWKSFLINLSISYFGDGSLLGCTYYKIPSRWPDLFLSGCGVFKALLELSNHGMVQMRALASCSPLTVSAYLRPCVMLFTVTFSFIFYRNPMREEWSLERWSTC